jgi:hypothetical protein
MSTLSLRELRGEARRKMDGPVRVRFANPRVVEVEGRLVDISASGFRMAHNFVALAAGQVVEFSHVQAAGQARVVWNRVLAKRVETGFVVVNAGSSA